MRIECFRCHKPIESPDARNADYIMAADTVVIEEREILVALLHNEATLAKRDLVEDVLTNVTKDGQEDPPTRDLVAQQFTDDEFDEVEVRDVKDAQEAGPLLVKVLARLEPRSVQKTGIVCPECYKPEDVVIWGVHKKQERE